MNNWTTPEIVGWLLVACLALVVYWIGRDLDAPHGCEDDADRGMR